MSSSSVHYFNYSHNSQTTLHSRGEGKQVKSKLDTTMKDKDMPGSSPNLRSPGTSDILRHLIPHLESMTPKQVKRELLTITLETIKNNPQLKRQILKSIAHRAECVVKANDWELVSSVLDFALWLDKIVIPVPGENKVRKIENSAHPVDEFEKKPQNIIDCLHFDYQVREFDISVRGSKCLVLVGPNRVRYPYLHTRTVASQLEGNTIVWVDSGKVSGKVQWISGVHDSISLVYRDGTRQVFNSVFSVFPYLRTEGIQKIIRQQKVLLKEQELLKKMSQSQTVRGSDSDKEARETTEKLSEEVAEDIARLDSEELESSVIELPDLSEEAFSGEISSEGVIEELE